jgi:hypothetical protein
VPSLRSGLDLAQAEANSQMPRQGQLGFYLATTYDHANFYAQDRNASVVIRYSMSGSAQAALLQSGAEFRQTTYGRGSDYGVELYVPPAAFPTFNSLLGAGAIRMTIIPSR